MMDGPIQEVLVCPLCGTMYGRKTEIIKCGDCGTILVKEVRLWDGGQHD